MPSSASGSAAFGSSSVMYFRKRKLRGEIAEPERPEQQADQQKAEHGAELSAMQQRHDDAGRHQKNQNALQMLRVQHKSGSLWTRPSACLLHGSPPTADSSRAFCDAAGMRRSRDAAGQVAAGAVWSPPAAGGSRSSANSSVTRSPSVRIEVAAEPVLHRFLQRARRWSAGAPSAHADRARRAPAGWCACSARHGRGAPRAAQHRHLAEEMPVAEP